jgi:putative sterol carrier protein
MFTGGTVMSDAVTTFFDELARRSVPSLNRLEATLRFDLEHAGGVEQWFIEVDHQSVSVSHLHQKADCVVRMDRDLFGAIVEGRVNAMAALLRGLIGIKGDPSILVMFQRAFPDTAPSRPSKVVESAAQRS